MRDFRPVDVRRAIAVTESLGEPQRSDPFPQEALWALGQLVGADAVGYCESPLADGFGGYELCTPPPPPWLQPPLQADAREDPPHPVYCGGLARSVAVSDFLSPRAVRRNELYDAIWNP